MAIIGELKTCAKLIVLPAMLHYSFLNFDANEQLMPD